MSVKIKSIIRNNSQSLSTILALIIIMALLTVLSDHFLTVSNLMNVLCTYSNIIIISIGLTFVLITGGTDLSLGSIEAMCGAMVAVLMVNSGIPMIPAIIISIICGAVCGAINGAIISYLKFAPFITTLAMQSIARGIGLLITNGYSVTGFTENFAYVGKFKVFGWLPMPVIITLVCLVIAYVILNQTRFGANVYAIGSNEQAARLSGINVGRSKVMGYAIAGITGAIAGIIQTSRLNSGQATIGEQDVMNAIAGVVIGGTSFSGGVGKIQGTLVGALIISFIRNGLNILGVSAYWQQVAIGVIIVIALLVDALGKGEYKK